MIQKIILPLLLGLQLLTGCRSTVDDQSSGAEQSLYVLTEQVKNSTVSRPISISGNIEGSKTVRLGFMVAGKINHIAAREGELVYGHKLLASLDPANYSIAKELADIQVSSAEDEFNRLKAMHERKSVSDADFSKITFGLQQARTQQKLQAKNLSDTRLFSPMNGVLLKKLAEEGEIVGVGTPLFVVSDISTVKVNAFIPENELHAIRIGQEARVYISSLGETFTGTVKEVGSVAEATTRAFTVKIELSNPKLLIRPGMIAEIKLSSPKAKEVIGLPAEAVLRDLDNQSYVYVVELSEKKAYKRLVSIGAITDNRIEITSGIKEGETVVVGGQYKLSDGSSVIIK